MPIWSSESCIGKRIGNSGIMKISYMVSRKWRHDPRVSIERVKKIIVSLKF